jgi:hypothetical protein
MPDYLRLKQICLVAPAIEPAAATDIGAVMGLKGPKEVLGGLVFKVNDVERVKAAAAARGYTVDGNAFHMCGVNFRLVA